MASDDTLTIKVQKDDLGVLTRHRVRMATEQDYRDRALTPPGGNAPGEGDKPKDEASGDVPGIPGVVQVGTATG